MGRQTSTTTDHMHEGILMPHQVTMPVLGLTMEEGTITEWLKQPGDSVEKEEPLLVVETDKSAVEVVSPATGVLSQIIAQAGQTRSEEHTSELQSRLQLVCRLLLEKKKKKH